MQKYLIKGDVSGIQDFIFNVKSKGAAQSLKGRSFFLKILLEVSMREIFDVCDITKSIEIDEAKVSTSGGNFILQLELDAPPNIDGIQLKMSKALSLTGLNVMLCSVEITKTYQEALHNLNQKIRERKYQLFVKNDSFFEPFDRNDIFDLHYHSNKKDSPSKWQGITAQLKKNSHFLVEKFSSENICLKINHKTLELAGYRISFGATGIKLEEFLESLFPLGQTFKDLAQKGGNWGLQKLGVLAMDVDNLGPALEEFKDPKAKEFDEDVKAYNEFDKALQKFFNIELRRLIDKKFKGKVYVVTAGGDDSFFVGKWNTMLDLAIAINEAFLSHFKDKGLTISAGLVIVDPNFPVVRFAQMAEDALKDAKYRYDSKGNINLFGEVISWGVLKKEIYSLRSDFNRGGKSQLTSGLLAKARQTALRVVDDTGLRLSDFWEMSYYMRNFNKNTAKTLLDKYRDYLEESTNEKDELLRKSYRLIFPIAARLAEFDNRKQ